MSKRQPTPDVITPDEVMDSPALQGFDTFLRYRPAENLPLRNPDPAAANPGSGAVPSRSPGGTSPTGSKPQGYSPTGVTSRPKGPYRPPAIAVPVFRPGRKPKRALRAQDGHSMGEQALYQALWDASAA